MGDYWGERKYSISENGDKWSGPSWDTLGGGALVGGMCKSDMVSAVTIIIVSPVVMSSPMRGYLPWYKVSNGFRDGWEKLPWGRSLRALKRTPARSPSGELHWEDSAANRQWHRAKLPWRLVVFLEERKKRNWHGIIWEIHKEESRLPRQSRSTW